MGMGHVPARPFSPERLRPDLQGREHRGAGSGRHDLRDLWRAGERLAARFLQQRGGRLLATNLRVQGGEIDLLVAFGHERAAVEVKSGRSDRSDAFTAEKVSHVRDLAAALRPPVFRVDLVSVVFGTTDVVVRWIPRAT